MGYEDIDLAKIRVDEALKMGLESQRVHRELSAGQSGRQESIKAFLQSKIMVVSCFIVEYGRNIYCRTLVLIHFRPECV